MYISRYLVMCAVPRDGGLAPSLVQWVARLCRRQAGAANTYTLLNAGASLHRDGDSAPPLVQRVAGLCRQHLQSPGPEREVSALVLGRLLTRRDAGGVLDEFLAWAPAAAGGDGPDAAFLLPGVAVRNPVNAACAA